MSHKLRTIMQGNGRYTVYAEDLSLPEDDPKRNLILESDIDARFVTPSLLGHAKKLGAELPSREDLDTGTGAIRVISEYSQDADTIRRGGDTWFHKATDEDGVVRVSYHHFRHLPVPIQKRILAIKKAMLPKACQDCNGEGHAGMHHEGGYEKKCPTCKGKGARKT